MGTSAHVETARRARQVASAPGTGRAFNVFLALCEVPTPFAESGFGKGSSKVRAVTYEIEIGRGKRGRRAYSLDDIAIVPNRRTRDPKDVSVSWQIDAYKFEIGRAHV